MNKRTHQWPTSQNSAHRDCAVGQTFIAAPVFHFFSLWQCDPDGNGPRRIQTVQSSSEEVAHLYAEIGCDAVPFDEHRFLSLSCWLSDVSGTYFAREREYSYRRFDNGTRRRMQAVGKPLDLKIPVGNGSFAFGHIFALPLDKPGVVLVELIDRSGTYGAASKVLGRSQFKIVGDQLSNLDLQ